MNTPFMIPVGARLGAFMFSALLATSVLGHQIGEAVLEPPSVPSQSAPVVTVIGTLDELIIENRVSHSSIRYVSLRQDDGSSLTLSGGQLNTFTNGASVEASGRRNGDTLFVTAARSMPTPARPTVNKSKPATQNQPMQVQGTLLLAHADDFATGKSTFTLVVHGDAGQMTPLKLAVMPDMLQPGTSVIASGTKAADGFSLSASYIIVVAPPKSESRNDVVAKAATTNNVLVVLIKFSDSPGADPFTQAQVQQVMATNSNSVANYYSETSYGQHLLNVTVTPWLTSPQVTPAGCDYNTMATYGTTAANAAGFNLGASPSSSAPYQNVFYVFPQQGACGWAGLAYIGYGQAFSNGYNLLPVFAHELGHNFGLLHAASLNCSGQPISPGASGCTSSEYGDPFSVMGGQSTGSFALHFNAAQKSKLGWIPASSVATYASGTTTYTLTPIETAGGSTYAVRIPAAASRTFWLEYRQPIGSFDNGISYASNGAQVRVATPFQSICSGCADDTELLYMPAGSPGNYYSAALLVGQSFTDSGITMSVLSATPSALTVQVSGPGSSSSARADFNGDGKSDILWRQASTGLVQMWLMNGFSAPASANVGSGTDWSIAGTGDFNGDGKADLLWRRASDGLVQMWLMNGSTFISSSNIGTGTDWSIVGVGDFNGDGKADMLWRRASDGLVQMWLMIGTTPTPVAGYTPGTDWSVVAVADFNGDGKADILWRQASTGLVQMWLMNGSAVLSAANIGVGTDWSIAGVGDFNGDGKADILWRRGSDGLVQMWLMNGTAFVSASNIGVGTDWSVAGVGDFNGDGKADILWRRGSDGLVQMWLMNGATLSSAAALSVSTDWSIAAPK